MGQILDELEAFDEPEEFDYKNHPHIHSVQLEALVLEVFEVGDTYRWELVDCCGITHNSGTGFSTDAHALRAGLNVAITD